MSHSSLADWRERHNPLILLAPPNHHVARPPKGASRPRANANCPHMHRIAPHTWPCTRQRPTFFGARPTLLCVHKADRMSVSEYIEKHGLEKRVEEVLNACVKAKPAEPMEFMVRTARSGFADHPPST